MKGYEVTLKGTWYRADTAPADITMMRELSYRLRRDALQARALATASGVQAPQPAILFSLTARHGRSTRLAQPREGTFEATVFVPQGPNTFVAHRSRSSRAKTMLKWFLQDATCRSPVLVFDNEKTVVKAVR